MGKKTGEILRWYSGPPRNVVWDVEPGTSARSPYLGYIEFSLRSEYWVPDEVKDKFQRSDAESSAALAKIQEDLHPMKYRYEFDVGPSRLELTKMLRGRDPGNWVDDKLDDSCWQKAARNAKGISTSADLETASIVRANGSAFLLRCDTEDKITRDACELWLDGVYNGLVAARTLVPAAAKDAARSDAACFPPTVTDDLLFHLVLKHVKDRPSDADQPTATLVLESLQEAYPCGRE